MRNMRSRATRTITKTLEVSVDTSIYKRLDNIPRNSHATIAWAYSLFVPVTLLKEILSSCDAAPPPVAFTGNRIGHVTQHTTKQSMMMVLRKRKKQYASNELLRRMNLSSSVLKLWSQS